MSEIGEIRKAKEVGKMIGGGHSKLIWHACEGCGKERWVQLLRGNPISIRCHLCSISGSFASNWKGGRQKDLRGYIRVNLQAKDFFYSMGGKDGRVLEHRLKVAQCLGRCLQPWEIVHHKEGFAKDDNRYPETLQLVTDDRHKQITILENRIKRLEYRVLMLETENILLKKERRNEPHEDRVV